MSDHDGKAREGCAWRPPPTTSGRPDAPPRGLSDRAWARGTDPSACGGRNASGKILRARAYDGAGSKERAVCHCARRSRVVAYLRAPHKQTFLVALGVDLAGEKKALGFWPALFMRARSPRRG